MEGLLTINGSAIDIELKNRTLEKAEQGIDAAVATAGEWGGGRFRGPSFWYDLEKSLFALRGTFEIDGGYAGLRGYRSQNRFGGGRLQDHDQPTCALGNRLAPFKQNHFTYHKTPGPH